MPSSQSRVVPCTSETIARSWRRMALKRLDFPELVAPGNRYARTLLVDPALPVRARETLQEGDRAVQRALVIRAAVMLVLGIIDCDLKTGAKVDQAFPRSPDPRLDGTAEPLQGERPARSVLARTISFTASARVRSMRPFRKARWVNSPGPAGRNPLRVRRERSRWITGMLPWEMISALSSPV